MALNLTFQRWQFQIQTTGTGDGTVTGDGNGGMNTRSNGNLSFSRLLGTGARIVTNLGASIFRMLATGDGWDTLTNIGISFTQPLLRGSSPAIVEEPLTQAERDLVYQVRAFERFRRTFAVDVATRFYRLLETQDNVANQEANVKALEDLRARNEALAEAGRLSDIQVDQARQDELSSRDNLIQIQEGFQQQLDSFKLFLGLPIGANITLVKGEIEKLKVAEDLGDTSSDSLVAFAWKHRLDYLTDVGRFEDAKRQINVAADALRMGLDLQASINTTSAEGRPLEFRPERTPWSGGFTADLPLDRLPERNAYRSSLIAYEAAKRAVDLAGDTIQANIRDQLRQVRATRQTYQIQTNSVDLAARRVESTRLNLEAGRSSTRDVLESQRALLAAQNAATRALIDYSLTRLRLFNEAELLTVDKSGIMVDNERLADLLRT